MARRATKLIFLVLLLSGQLSAVAAEEIASAVQPQCLEIVGVRGLVEAHPDLTGDSVSLAMVELAQLPEEGSLSYAFMPNIEHSALKGARLRGLYCYQNPHQPLGYSEHASVIAGIIWGYDGGAWYDGVGEFEYRGIAPGVTVDIYDAKWFIYKQVLETEREPWGSDVVSISWGSDADDLITQWWQRGIDALVEQGAAVVIAGCGNGSDEFRSISKPSSGYNIISVGAATSLGSYPGCLSFVGPPRLGYSNFGPTDDGRCKPDIIAPGLCLAPGSGGDDEYNYSGNSIGYSSFAVPQVVGVAALLIDAARKNGLVDGDDPRVVRALLLNGANKLIGWHKGLCGGDDDSDVPLDYQQGAGLLDAGDSYRQLVGGRYDENKSAGNDGWDMGRVSLNPDDPNSEKIYYLPEPLAADSYLAVTLCWYRHYAAERFYRPEKLGVLSLELWLVDESGQFVKRLDHSTSDKDNLQHIYYHAQCQCRAAIVVAGGGAEQNQSSGYEVYGLAYGVKNQDWQGDQMSADLDADGEVGTSDLLRFLGAWWYYKNIGSSILEQYLPEDINNDGLVNGIDFKAMSDQWQSHSAWK